MALFHQEMLKEKQKKTRKHIPVQRRERLITLHNGRGMMAGLVNDLYQTLTDNNGFNAVKQAGVLPLSSQLT